MDVRLCREEVHVPHSLRGFARRAVTELPCPCRSPVSLSLMYGMQNVGMDYDRSLFGMKLSDCRSLAKALERTETLTYLNLSNNLLDDDKVRMIASGMVENISITNLDLSHNKIADRGVRALAKLLDNRSVIAILNLADNQIHSEGGRALARAIRGNFSLISLNVRLNRLGDDGGRTICDVLRANQVMERLNIGSNQLGSMVMDPLSLPLYLLLSPRRCFASPSCHPFAQADRLPSHV